MDFDINLIKALANENRLEIYEFIYERKFLIKNDVLEHFQMNRASLDHHLEKLEEANLVSILNLEIANRMYAFLIPNYTVTISREPIKIKDAVESIPLKISSDIFSKITEEIWLKNENDSDLIIVLSQIAERLDLNAWELFCKICREKIAIITCSKCGKRACKNCSQIITKTDETKVVLCEQCIEESFS